MSRRALLLIVVAGLAGWWFFGGRNSWRYKMTVEVQTPDGLRSGSAVRKVSYTPSGIGFLAESRPHWRLRGQAVAVDLPGGRTLYALLRSAGGGCFGDVDYATRIADRALGGHGGRITGLPGPVELFPTPPDRGVFKVTSPFPMFVTFKDPRDSRSVQVVDPNDLEAAFGPGYALKRITIDVVVRPLTDDIQKRLGWLTDHRQRSLDPGFQVTSNPTIAQCLTHRDFLQR